MTGYPEVHGICRELSAEFAHQEVFCPSDLAPLPTKLNKETPAVWHLDPKVVGGTGSEQRWGLLLFLPMRALPRWGNEGGDHKALDEIPLQPER